MNDVIFYLLELLLANNTTVFSIHSGQIKRHRNFFQIDILFDERKSVYNLFFSMIIICFAEEQKKNKKSMNNVV